MNFFHSAVSAWFNQAFSAPTEPQLQAWPAIKAGRHVLIAAPTGSGKTLAAFLAAIDDLVQIGTGTVLSDQTFVVYISPLKALSNDIQKNLNVPLAGIREQLKRLNLPDVEIRTWVRTGDTSQKEREQMRKRPPHIVVTTPESLYILLGSTSGRKMLSTTRAVIVDEIHALASNKRGAHLALSLQRLQALVSHPLIRIGLSATQKPIEEVAQFLVGAQQNVSACTIINTGHVRTRDLAIELPDSPLEAVMSNEVWQQVYNRLAELIHQHRTTLIFVNTRRMAERVARHLTERLGEENITSHHGSLAKEQRLNAEQRLKSGKLKALVATASLELGIDIGEVELVCQLGSTRSIATFLQRAGRAGHSVGGTPKARLFPLSRDELVECAALLDAVRRKELDRLIIPQQPLDVLAQQIVAEVANQEWSEEALYKLVCSAYPYRNLTYESYSAVIHMLAAGFSSQHGQRALYIHRDAVNRLLRGRRGAKLISVTSGGTIPDNADYEVVLEPMGQCVGTVNEDFAVESLAGDIFQLGNTSYRILRVERGKVRVEDAKGQPPTIPFWLGEAPGRTDELSFAVSRLRQEISLRLEYPHPNLPPARGRGKEWPKEAEQSIELETHSLPLQGRRVEPAPDLIWGWGYVLSFLVEQVGINQSAAEQIVSYLFSAQKALGVLPTQHTIIFERFFDESGGMQLVIHSPFGSRVNRAWGLALRKRFCRKFNFELQGAATEDSIVLSLSTSHSFPLEEVAHYLHANTVRQILIQAMLDAPMFTARWRWNATTALALPRFRGGKKVAPQLLRMQAEDLIAAVFPDQIACAENIVGDRDIPDHPLVNQTVHDCLYEAMDIEGLEKLLKKLDSGDIKIIAKEVTEPSPLALEILSARPYAFLDDAPLEERRAQAVMSRRWLDPQTASDIGRLDPAAIEKVRQEAWPSVANADEMHEALMLMFFFTEGEKKQYGWDDYLETLINQKRAIYLQNVTIQAHSLTLYPSPEGRGIKGEGQCLERAEQLLQDKTLWVAIERLPLFQAVFPELAIPSSLIVPEEFTQQVWAREKALQEIVRGRLQGLGPVTAEVMADSLNVSKLDIEAALIGLETEGVVLRGSFSSYFSPQAKNEWCERGLLARIHRYTLKKLRQEIEPVETRDFMRFLFKWQRVFPEERLEGPEALDSLIAQLEGFEAPAATWETEILPARMDHYELTWLDDLCLAGRVIWTRLQPCAQTNNTIARGPVRTTPITLLPRRHALIWNSLKQTSVNENNYSSRAQTVHAYLAQHGASFFDEIVNGTSLLRTQIEEALAELVARGEVNSDSFTGLRALLVPSDRRKPLSGASRRHRRRALLGIEDAGRWNLLRRVKQTQNQNANTDHVARTLLRRYGVVFWRLLEREADSLPPWRDLLRCYRQLEARGEIRGGRFIAAVTGEQFALPEAVELLRATKRQEASQEWLALSAADPANLVGILPPVSKVPNTLANRVLYRDGIAIAAWVSGEVQWLQQLEASERKIAGEALIRQTYTGAIQSNA